MLKSQIDPPGGQRPIGTRINLIYAVILIVFGLSVLSAASPSVEPLPGRDQGVYLYIGRGILQGGIPYRDFWDHKGPLIYYINALGLLLAGKSYWGVWFLEILALAVAATLSFRLLQKTFGNEPAFWGTMVWLAGLSAVLSMGNTVEEFALPLEFLQIYLVLTSLRAERAVPRYFLIGAVAGLAFLLRPNIVGIFLSICILSAWEFLSLGAKQKMDIALNLIAAAAGMGSMFLIAYGYLATQNAGGQFLDAAFTYNFVYSALEKKTWGAFLSALDRLPVLTTLAFGSWAGGFASLLARGEENPERRFIRLLVIALPVQLFFSLTSGRDYLHYFISWLPVMGLLAGLFASYFLRGFETLLQGRSWLYAMLLGICFLPFSASLGGVRLLAADLVKHGGLPDPNFNRSPSVRLIQSLQQASLDHQYFLFWGNEVEYNFILDRKAPSRFLYLTPLFTPSYATPAMANAFLLDIQMHQPLIVVDSGDSSARAFPFVQSSVDWTQYPAMLPVMDYLKQHYRVGGKIDVYEIFEPVP